MHENQFLTFDCFLFSACTYHVNPTSVPHLYTSKGAFYPCPSSALHNTHTCQSCAPSPYFTDSGNHSTGFHSNSIHISPDVQDNKNLKDGSCIRNGHVVSDNGDHRDGYHGNRVGRRHRSIERLPPVIPPKQHKHSYNHSNKCSLPSAGVFRGTSPQQNV